MTITDPSAAPTTEAGHAVGNGWMSGYPWDPSEATAELSWPTNVAVYDRMRRQDAQVKSILNAVTLPIRRAVWRIDPNEAPEAAVNLIAQDLGLGVVGMKTSAMPLRRRQSFDWADHLRQATLALVYGHMPFEKKFELRADGLAHLVRLGVRMPATIAKININRAGELVSVEQYPSGTPGDVGPLIPIIAEHLVMYSHEREAGLWQGQSMLRTAYRPWLVKDRLIRVDAMKHERNGMGIPIAEAPPNATPAMMADLNNLASKLRAGEWSGGAVPQGTKITLVGVSGSLPDTLASIKYHDEQIAREALAQFLELVSSSHGSRALATSLIDFFIMALQSTADEIADTFNEQLIEPWVDWNWGPTVPAPRLVPGEIGDDHGITAESIAALITSGAIEPDPSLDAYLRENFRMPERDPAHPWTPPAKPSANAGTPVQLRRADPKVHQVHAAREDAPNWPGHKYFLALTSHYGPAIAQASTERLDPRQTAEAFLSSGLTPQAFVAGLTLDTEAFLDVLRAMYGEAYLAGYHAGDLQIQGVGVPPAPAPWDSTTIAAAAAPEPHTPAITPEPVGESGVNWSAWQPGNNEAAALVAANDQSSGLAELLHEAGIVLNGIDSTTLDSIADVLAEALAAGSSVSETGDMIGALLDDPDRAELIAQTETARAMTAASLDSYSENGVTGKAWLLSDGACPLCEENEADGVIPIDEDFTNGDPPAHVNCVCALIPAFDDTGGEE